MPLRSRLLLSFGVCTFAFALAAGAQDVAPVATPVAATSDARPAQLADYDAYVDAVRKQFDVPGIAVAIVKDGKVVLEMGSGVRRMGEAAKVDAHTQFAIASNTKAFTAASLAMLADEKKLDMNDRVIDHLPWFQMSDPYVTREMRVRDLLAHRSGLSLGAGDLLYWPATTYSTEEVVQRLRNVPLTNSFRAEYAYDNILFAVAGLVIEKVSGKSYEDFLHDRIFVPLGMTETRTNVTSVKSGDDVAFGHAKYNFKELKPVEPMAWANNTAAGGIYSSVHDMSKWMRMQLDSGVYGKGADDKDQRLFSVERQKEMWSLITPIRIPEPSVPELAAAKPNFSGYGEGWFVSDYRGHKLVWHTGGWPGMVSRVTLVPDLKLGIVVLTNQESGAAFQAVTMRGLDAFMDAPKTDWIAAYAAAVKKAEAKADDSMQKHEGARAKGSKPSLPLDGYAGTYKDPWYGDVTVKKEGGKLVMRFSKTAQLTGTMEPWQHDTFIVRWNDRSLNGDAFVNFALDPDGKIREVRMEPVSPLTDFSFDFQDLRLVPKT
ncbi:CubicO group peptidase (beta-lactamase class C family) [Luteibacter rhizovicinus]|uniref:CubicO group peptidase (Beta-lactamase class C family) n=1 Tax=Luteibacter rhizovicinus TaxID=242606 RepID=A0A4R3YQ83_9GAMM|nr:serine hydrolase [Luteibacter rhizovicinus]TCV94570.1 CubicO group peptidase (beta-lactamase class C family) [Luteibacter rhizovicinus]